jgi:hypothetical protein
VNDQAGPVSTALGAYSHIRCRVRAMILQVARRAATDAQVACAGPGSMPPHS